MVTNPATLPLTASKEFDVRFSEVDAMNVVWHGAYPLYFEDAREAFGARYGLEYMTIARHGYFAPLVELNFRYLRPLRYEHRYRIDITYRPTESAKIIFDYAIHDIATDDLMATGHLYGQSVSVAMVSPRLLPRMAGTMGDT